MRILEVYTDGSATVSNKPGGWAYVIVIDGKKCAEGAGHLLNCTNNDAETHAAIEGLKRAMDIWVSSGDFADANASSYDVTLVSDSQLVLGWVSGRYRFKQENKIDKYDQLMKLVRQLKVKTRWVRGHSGDEHNERCDKLANEARLIVQNRSDQKDDLSQGKSIIGIKKSGVFAIWYGDVLKILDLENNIIEDYNKEVHGKRSSRIQIGEER